MATTTAVTVKRASRMLVQFAWGVVGYNVLVILWGALVRATGSGAGCGNHWPLCNGQVIPLSPRLDTIIEFTHRCMTGGSTFLVLGLLFWTFRGTVKGQAARRLAVTAMVLLLNEAFLGALLVKLGYVTGNQSVGRVVVLSIHLSNTLLLLAALTLTARLLGTGQLWHELGDWWGNEGLGAFRTGSFAGSGGEWVAGSARGHAIPCFFIAGGIRAGLFCRIAMAASAAGRASDKCGDSWDLRALAGGTGEAGSSRTTGLGGAGVAWISVRAGTSRCSAVGAGVDADCSPAGSGSVLDRSGCSRSKRDLAKRWRDVVESGQFPRPKSSSLAQLT
jgi:hypothetical protein